MREPIVRHRFRHPIQVRFADTDAQGHVYFSNYLVYCDEALSAYLHAIGHPWQSLQAQGIEFYFMETGYRFTGSARFADRLDVHCRIARLGNTSFTAEMSVFRGDEALGAGFITAVMVDPASRRPVPIPDAFRRAVEAFERAG